MKQKALTNLLLALVCTAVYSQDTLTMPVTGNGGIYNTCYAVIYDNGGADSNYTDYSNSTITIAPLWVQTVSLFFEEFNTEVFFDSISIYDGPGVTFPLIGTYSGNSLQGQTISSTGGAITILFRSDDIETGTGFKVWVSCLLGNEVDNEVQNVWVYPNPGTNNINIGGVEESMIKHIFLTDVMGRTMYTHTGNLPINVWYLQQGIYYVNMVLNNGQVKTWGWIKQ